MKSCVCEVGALVGDVQCWLAGYTRCWHYPQMHTLHAHRISSKLKYGLQLIGKIRWSVSDTQNGDLLSLQKVQNKLARFLNNKRISDKISIKSLMANIGFLSVNQIYKAKIAIIKYCLTLPI